MSAPITLYNTLTRSKEPFAPADGKCVRLYTCGPTVYHYAHIGNLRMYVFQDVLVRVLKRAGFEVDHVMNITDVGHLVSDGDEGEDKMEKGSRREGKTAWEIAEYYANVFFDDCKDLNVVRPNQTPKATDHVPEMIAIVESLEKKGIAYKTSDGVYFDTSKFESYGKMAKLDIENLEAGKRVEMRDKRNATDFALWKFSPAGEQRQMEWDSPWGKGFPGWHIECSAMSMKYLGNTLDIHCGGKDHIPVHHTNEIAQSEASTGVKFSHFWMHGDFVLDETGKMAKSDTEFLTLSFVKSKGFDAMDYRFLLLQAHYRKEIVFNFETLTAAKQGLQGIRNRFAEWKDLDQPVEANPVMDEHRASFDKAVFDDLNVPMGLSVFFEILKDSRLSDAAKKELVLEFDQVFGLRFMDELTDAQAGLSLSDEVQALVRARDEARKSKNWSESDRLRGDLQSKGYEVLDSPSGTKLRRK